MSILDMKPIHPYLQLVPLKDYSIKQMNIKAPSGDANKNGNAGNGGKKMLFDMVNGGVGGGNGNNRSSSNKLNYFSKLERELNT